MDPVTMLFSGEGLKLILAILAVLGIAGAAWKVKGWKDDKRVSQVEAEAAKFEADSRLSGERARAEQYKAQAQAQAKTAQTKAEGARTEEKIRHETNTDDVMSGLDSMFDGFRVPGKDGDTR